MTRAIYTYRYRSGTETREFRLSERSHGKYVFHHIDHNGQPHTGRYFTDNLENVDRWVFSRLEELYRVDTVFPGRAPSSSLYVDVHYRDGRTFTIKCSLLSIDTFYDGVVEGPRGARVISKNF